jgi:replicative DNA helicase
MAKNLKTAELERSLISHFFKDPGWLGEVSGMIKSDFFAYIPHQKIFAAIKALYAESKTIDYHILISRLNLMGLTTIEGLETAEYLTAVSQMFVNSDAKKACLDELMKFYWSRQTYKKLIDAQKFIEKSLESPDLTFSDILNGTEKIVTDALTFESAGGDDASFVDLNGEMENLLNNRVNNKDKVGLESPFPIFNRWFGPFLTGGLYIFAASSKVGKSTFLNALSSHFVETGLKREKGRVYALTIDTELKSEEVACRNMAAESGVNAFFYLNGRFTEDGIRIKKTQDALPKFQNRKGLSFHKYLPNADTEKIISIVRRFHSKYIGPDDTLTVFLDYLKLGSSEGGLQEMKEYQLIERKSSAMKDLAEELPNTIAITAIQTNAQNNVAMADRVKWAATSVMALNRKSQEEIGQESKRFGTHTISATVIRNLGEFADEGDAFPAMNGNNKIWVPNHINLDFSNFKVVEKGTHKDVYEALQSSGQRPIRETASEKQKEALKKYKF